MYQVLKIILFHESLFLCLRLFITFSISKVSFSSELFALMQNLVCLTFVVYTVLLSGFISYSRTLHLGFRLETWSLRCWSVITCFLFSSLKIIASHVVSKKQPFGIWAVQSLIKQYSIGLAEALKLPFRLGNWQGWVADVGEHEILFHLTESSC